MKELEKLEEALSSLNNFRLDYLKIDESTRFDIEAGLVVDIYNCIDHIYGEINRVLLIEVESKEV